jgi:hypothetical protein
VLVLVFVISIPGLVLLLVLLASIDRLGVAAGRRRGISCLSFSGA